MKRKIAYILYGVWGDQEKPYQVLKPLLDGEENSVLNEKEIVWNQYGKRYSIRGLFTLLERLKEGIVIEEKNETYIKANGNKYYVNSIILTHLVNYNPNRKKQETLEQKV